MERKNVDQRYPKGEDKDKKSNETPGEGDSEKKKRPRIQPKKIDYSKPQHSSGERRPYKGGGSGGGYKKSGSFQQGGRGRPGRTQKLIEPKDHPEGIRVNRFIANSGVCSRRDADILVENGEISINGEVVKTLGVRIGPKDVVTYKGKELQGEPLQYILFNKPKDCITSADDPEGRTTVMKYLDGCCTERIFPVGRLDRNTTGLLLFTNDGHLAEKLMHPRNRVKKLYHVKLDNPVTKENMRQIQKGIKLEDGWIKADQIAYVGTNEDRTEVGIEIHSGKNRVIRRIFEKLDYDVVKLDRVIFAGLTKKDLKREKYRNLTPDEVKYLKML